MSANAAYSLSAPDGDPAKAVTVDNEGRVGIGTSPSAEFILDVGGKAKISELTVQPEQSIGAVARFTGNPWASAGDTSRIELGDEYHYVEARQGGPFAINSTDPIVLQPAGGYVGIGNSAPDHTLLVGPDTGGRNLVVNDGKCKRWGFQTDNGSLSIQNDKPMAGTDPDSDVACANQYDETKWHDVLSLEHTGDVVVHNDLQVEGNLKMDRTYQVYYLNAGPNAGKNVNMGQWDLCAMLSYEAKGVDDQADDWARCYLGYTSTPGSYAGRWADEGPDTLSDRPEWNMNVHAADQVDEVRCEAICMNFGIFGP
jgi:hypothetical protein